MFYLKKKQFTNKIKKKKTNTKQKDKQLIITHPLKNQIQSQKTLQNLIIEFSHRHVCQTSLLDPHHFTSFCVNSQITHNIFINYKKQ